MSQFYSAHVFTLCFAKIDEGPERKQRYSSTLSLTSDLDGGGWLKPRSGRFTPGKETKYSLYRAPEPVWTVRKILPPPEFDPLSVKLVANHYTGWAIAIHQHGM